MRPGANAVATAGVEHRFQEALALHKSGRAGDAQPIYRDVLRENPRHGGAWHLLGVALYAQGDLPAAHAHIRKALSLRPDKAVYWNKYGAVLKEMGGWRDAEAALRRALELKEDYADAWSNLGHVQELLDLPPSQAERSFQNALTLDPNHVDARFRLGDLYQKHGRHGEAAREFRRGLELAPERPGGRKRLARALAATGAWKSAQKVLEEAVVREPNDPDLHLSLGVAHAGQDRIEEAKRSYYRAARLRRGHPLWRWKHLGICPTVFDGSESIDRYWGRLEASLDEALDEPMTIDWRSLPYDGYTPSFNLPHHGRCCRQVREKFAARFESAFPATRPAPSGCGRIRVGFLITAGHEPGFLRGMAKIVEGLDSARFEAVLFCDRHAVEAFRRAVHRPAVRFVPLTDRFTESVAAVQAARCDVIHFWKVGPDPWSYFLPMARLAPIQCTSSGSHGTSGVRAIDYYLSSKYMECPDETVDSSRHYTEKLFLFDTFSMFQARQPSPNDVERSEFGLPEKGAVYMCPHRLPKYHPEFDLYLRDILRDDRTGCVVVISGSAPHAQEALRQRMERNIGRHDFSRIRFFDSLPVSQYYRLLKTATLVLDPPVYASSLTAYDAFSVGVPVLTQPGPLAVQCYAAGLYRCMEIQGLTASGQADYVKRAVEIGTQPEEREALVSMLRQRDDAVFSDHRTVVEYERFFVKAVEASKGG